MNKPPAKSPRAPRSKPIQAASRKPQSRPAGTKPAPRLPHGDVPSSAAHPAHTAAHHATGMIAVQIAAAAIVGRVLSGKNLDRELADSLAKLPNLSVNERQAVHSISFDTLRHYGLINAQLDTLLTAPLTDTAVRHLLLVSLAQLQFSRAAAHTVVDHAVNAAVAMGFARAKGLANAVLRNYLRTPEKFARQRFKDEVAQYDFPRWWIARVQAEHPQHWQSILESSQQRPPMILRVNRRQYNAEQYLAKLAASGIAARALGDTTIALDSAVSVNALPGFAEGAASVQDWGAQLAAALLDVRDGMRVLDACAAPGGKTGHLLECANLQLTAIDTDKLRLKRVAENLARLRCRATLLAADVANLDMWWTGEAKKQYERILLDVPCSGAGVTRRHPDIKWIRRETDLKRFAESQLRLLHGVWPTLATKGKLLYVTCSVFNAENREVIDQFLRVEPTAIRLPMTPTQIPADWRSDFSEQQLHDELTLLPNADHDGFYYALLQKA
jgi:16S rRNA (cytosine967-C5)-methyltransferase